MADVGVVGLSGAHVLAVAGGVDGGLSHSGVLGGVEAGAGSDANLVLGVVHAVEVGVAGARGGGGGVGVSALHAAENLVGAADLGQGDHGLKFAAAVGVAGAEGVVVRVAGAEAAVDVGVVLAHVVGVAGNVVGDHLAAGLALVDRGVPHAFVVAVAGCLVGPAPFAFLGADACGGAPDAHVVEVAGLDGVDGPAVLLAGGAGGVPDAALVAVACTLGGVLDAAGGQAVGSVPAAVGVGLAVEADVVGCGVGDLLIAFAVVAALVELRSPFALRVSIAGGGSVVAELALDVA